MNSLIAGITVEPFKPEHLYQINLQKHETEIIGRHPEVFIAVATSPLAVTNTFWFKGSLGVIGGHYIMWEGVAEIFLLVSVDIFRYPKTFIIGCEYMFNKVKSDMSLHRIQAPTLDDSRRSRFLQRHGFVDEGVLKQYTSDRQDYRMWAFVR
jgi:hypothetical protein